MIALIVVLVIVLVVLLIVIVMVLRKKTETKPPAVSTAAIQGARGPWGGKGGVATGPRPLGVEGGAGIHRGGGHHGKRHRGETYMDRARAAMRNSDLEAQSLNGAYGASGVGGSPQVSGAYVPGGSAADQRVANASATASAAVNGQSIGGPQGLGTAFVHMDNPYLSSASKTQNQNSGTLDDIRDFTDAYMGEYMDKDDYDKVTKALSLSGTPDAFHADEAATLQARNAAIVNSVMLDGKPNPTLEQIMGSTAPFTATKCLIQKALRAQSAVDRETIIQTPLRFLNQGPLYMPPVPFPTMGIIPPDTVTPGWEIAAMSVTCGANDGPITMEPY